MIRGYEMLWDDLEGRLVVVGCVVSGTNRLQHYSANLPVLLYLLLTSISEPMTTGWKMENGKWKMKMRSRFSQIC
jgi:hypothetical protein